MSEDPQKQKHINILRSVLEKLSKCKLEPTPANFSMVYREVASDLGYPAPLNDSTDTSLVLYTITALEDLLIANEWLASEIWSLKAQLADTEISEQEKGYAVKKILGSIVNSKDSLILELGQASLQFKESMGALFQEVERLATNMTGFKSSLSAYNEHLANCFSIDDAKSVMTAVLFELDKINKTVDSSKSSLSSVENHLKENPILSGAEPKKRTAVLDLTAFEDFIPTSLAVPAKIACLAMFRLVSPEHAVIFDEHVKEAISSSIRTTDLVSVSSENTILLLLPDATYHAGATVQRRIRDRASGCRMDGTLITFNFGFDRAKSFQNAYDTVQATFNAIVKKGGGVYPPLDI